MSGCCWLPAACVDWAAADVLTATWAPSKQMRISAVTFGCAIDLLIVIIWFLLGLVASAFKTFGGRGGGHFFDIEAGQLISQ
jgi:hypothetical protein